MFNTAHCVSIFAQRARIVRRQAESVIQFGTSMLAFCETGGDIPPEERAALADVFAQLYAPLPRELQQLLREFDAELSAQFDQKVKPRLITGAMEASKKCVSTAETWSQSWTKGGGLHWATYKACCRRDGAWRINMNEALASPILTSVSSAWESVFVKDLGGSLNAFVERMQMKVRRLSTFPDFVLRPAW